jgi:hypothetical protein
VEYLKWELKNTQNNREFWDSSVLAFRRFLLLHLSDPALREEERSLLSEKGAQLDPTSKITHLQFLSIA